MQELMYFSAFSVNTWSVLYSLIHLWLYNIAKYTNTFTLTYLNVIAEYHRITGKFGERKFGELIDQLIDY